MILKQDKTSPYTQQELFLVLNNVSCNSQKKTVYELWELFRVMGVNSTWKLLNCFFFLPGKNRTRITPNTDTFHAVLTSADIVQMIWKFQGTWFQSSLLKCIKISTIDEPVTLPKSSFLKIFGHFFEFLPPKFCNLCANDLKFSNERNLEFGKLYTISKNHNHTKFFLLMTLLGRKYFFQTFSEFWSKSYPLKMML